jgi:hypothetical protein
MPRPPGIGRAAVKAAGQPKVAANAASDQFYVELQVTPEPRILVAQNGAMRLTEAVDDRDQSMLFIPPVGLVPAPRPMSGWGPMVGLGSPAIHMRVDLKYPAQPGRLIKRLKGTVPVIVAARKEDPLVVPLADAKGKTFRNSEMSLVVHDIKPEPELRRTQIELSVRHSTPATESPGGPGRFGPDALMLRNGGIAQNQIEIYDSQGRLYPQMSPPFPRFDQDEPRLALTLMLIDNLGPPAQLKYYDMVRASSEAAFELTDIPMP